MAFCTECGKQLSDSAVFCPNCGHKRSVPSEAPEEEQRIDAQAAPAESPEDTGENAEKETNSPAEAEKEGKTAESPEAEPAPEPEGNRWSAGSTRTESSYGYNTYGNNNLGYKSHDEIAKKNNSKAAIIVIATVVVLLAVAIILFISLSKGEDFVGYWESEEVDLGTGFDDELFGRDVKGMFGLQLNEDNTYRLLSAFNSEIVSGPWKETDSGIQLQNQMESITLSYKNRQLLLQVGGYTFALEHSDGSIDNPTLPAGKYAGSGNELPDAPDSSSGVPVPDDGQKPVSPSGSPSISGSGEVGNGDFYISVVGAEEFTDTEGDPAIRIYYEYTNNFDFPETAYNTIDWEAVQDGESLEFAYSWDDVEVYNNDLLSVRPGLTVQCCVQFKYDPNGGTVDASFFGWSAGKSGGRVLASYVPGQLPGAPAPYEYEPIPDPEWTTSELDSEGYLDNGKCYVEVTDAKLIQDSYGLDAVRVFYRFTNKYNEPVSFYSATTPIVYQDGIGLPESYAEISAETDDRANDPVEPGQTVEVSCVFRLRNNTSSIEAEVEGVDTYAAVGQTYKIS